MALVRAVIILSADLTSRWNVAGSTSVKTGLAPTLLTASAVAKKGFAGTRTSPPGPISETLNASSQPDVPDETPTAYLAPIYEAKDFSKFSTNGPPTTCADSKTSPT